MSGALAILVFGGLLTIMAIDHPFAGAVHVGPDALLAVVEDFAGATRSLFHRASWKMIPTVCRWPDRIRLTPCRRLTR